jgi:hypothetical protein
MPYHLKKAKGKDGFYVYGVDGTRHSKVPLSLEMAKKQMSALNIAHAKKSGAIITTPRKPHRPVKDTKIHSIDEHPIVKKSKMIEKVVEVASMAGKHGMHSPAGVLSPLVSETTGGGSGLANDARWVSSVHSGGRKTQEEKAEKVEDQEKDTMTTKQKQMAYMEYYKAGKMPNEVPAHLKRGYTTFHKRVMASKAPKWYKE